VIFLSHGFEGLIPMRPAFRETKENRSQYRGSNWIISFSPVLPLSSFPPWQR
jgi:hypothetical protein